MRAILPSLLLAAVCVAAAPSYAQPVAVLATECQAPPSAAGGSMRGTLETELRQAARAAGVAEPRGIVFAEVRNRRARASAFRSNVPDQVSRGVLERNAEQLAGWSACGGILNLRLDSAAVPAAAGAGRVPVLVNVDELTREVRRLSAAESSRPGVATRRVTLHLTMLVTRDGEVAHAALKRPSMNSEVDRQLLVAARRLRFRPAVVDGAPADVWVELPVEMDLPNR